MARGQEKLDMREVGLTDRRRGCLHNLLGQNQIVSESNGQLNQMVNWIKWSTEFKWSTESIGQLKSNDQLKVTGYPDFFL